jgi:hypothetical protein
MVVGLAGCGSSSSDDTASLITDMCNKMDSCGLLSADETTGMTMAQCKSMAEATSGDNAPASQKSAAKACIAKSCTEFMTCLAAIK